MVSKIKVGSLYEYKRDGFYNKGTIILILKVKKIFNSEHISFFSKQIGFDFADKIFLKNFKLIFTPKEN